MRPGEGVHVRLPQDALRGFAHAQRGGRVLPHQGALARVRRPGEDTHERLPSEMLRGLAPAYQWRRVVAESLAQINVLSQVFTAAMALIVKEADTYKKILYEYHRELRWLA